MTSGSFRSVSRPRNRRKSQSARLRVLASQSEVALDRSETFLRNQDPSPTFEISSNGRSRHGQVQHPVATNAPHLIFLHQALAFASLALSGMNFCTLERL